MSKEEQMLEHSAQECQHVSGPTKNEHVFTPQDCAAGQFDEVVAAINNDLRARSQKANELLERSIVTMCRTAEMIACSREAIAQSRIMLTAVADPSYRFDSECATDVDAPVQEALNARLPRPSDC